MNLKNLIYDITDEILNGDLVKISNFVDGLSDDCRTAYIPSIDEQNDMPKNKFAVVLYDRHEGFMPKYACYTKELVEINTKFLANRAEHLPDEVVKVASYVLKLKCGLHGIEFPEVLEKYASSGYRCEAVDINEINKRAFIEKLAAVSTEVGIDKLADDAFALPSKRKYPIHTPEYVEKAAQYWKTYRNEFDLEDRIEFATNMARVTGNPEFSKYANLNLSRENPNMADLIKIRKGYTHDPEIAELYDDFLDKHASLNGGVKEKIKVLHEIDKKANLQYVYDTKILNPILVVLDGEREKVAEYGVDGKIFTSEELSGLSGMDTSEWINADVKESLMGDEGHDVFMSLPKPTRDGLFGLMGK